MTTPYRVYIAASSVPSEIDRVEHWAARLVEAGIDVISTWPRNIREVGVTNPRDATRDQRREWAQTCANQVALSNALWLLCPPDGVTTRGAWFELGTADACGTEVICSGDTLQTIFTSLAAEECFTDESAFAVLKCWAAEFVAKQRFEEERVKRTKAVRK